MPCRCSGVKYERCACRVVGGYQGRDERVLIVAQESICRAPNPRKPRNMWFKIYENLYERCAGYNLRYCPLRGVCHKNFLNEAVRDLALLVFFLVANLVIFLTIFARMTVHASFAVVASARWLRRSLLKKLLAPKETMILSELSSQQVHNFSPPQKIF